MAEQNKLIEKIIDEISDDLTDENVLRKSPRKKFSKPQTITLKKQESLKDEELIFKNYFSNLEDKLGSYDRKHYYSLLILKKNKNEMDTIDLYLGQIFYSYSYGDTPLVAQCFATSGPAKTITSLKGKSTQKRFIYAIKFSGRIAERKKMSCNPNPKIINEEKIVLTPDEISEIIPMTVVKGFVKINFKDLIQEQKNSKKLKLKKKQVKSILPKDSLAVIQKKKNEKKLKLPRKNANSQQNIYSYQDFDKESNNEIIDPTPIINVATPKYTSKSIFDMLSEERKHSSDLFSQTMRFMQDQWNCQMNSQEKMLNKIMESNERIVALANKQLDTINKLKNDANQQRNRYPSPPRRNEKPDNINYHN